MNETEQAIEFVVDAMPNLTTLELAKVLYLADIYHRMLTSAPVTRLHWIRFPNGPFDSDIFYRTERLQEDGYLEIERAYVHQKRRLLYRLRKPLPQITMSPLKRSVLRRAIEMAKSQSLTAFVNMVYATPPMENAEPKKGLPMDRVNGIVARRLPPDLQAAFEETPEDPVLLSLALAPVANELVADETEQRLQRARAGGKTYSQEDLERELLAG